MMYLTFSLRTIMMYTAQLMANIGENIRKYRKLRDMSLDDLARHCSCTSGYLGRLERWEDGYRNPSFETLTELAKALGVNLRDIVPDFGDQLASVGAASKVAEPRPSYGTVSNDEQEMLTLWREMSPEQKRIAKSMINQFVGGTPTKKKPRSA